MSVMESDTTSTKTRHKRAESRLKFQRSLTHWPRTLCSCCRRLWRRSHFVSSAEGELCRGRRHPRRSPSSWSPCSAEMMYSLTHPHEIMKTKQTQLCSIQTCEIALNALVLPNFSPSLERDSAECIAVFAAPSTPSLNFFPKSVRLTSSSPYNTDTRTDASTV